MRKGGFKATNKNILGIKKNKLWLLMSTSSRPVSRKNTPILRIITMIRKVII